MRLAARRKRLRRGPIAPGELLDTLAREVLIGARRAAQLTQKELAKRLDRPASYVGGLECGDQQIHRSDFIAYAHALGTEPGALFAEVLARAPDRTQQWRTRRKVTP